MQPMPNSQFPTPKYSTPKFGLGVGRWVLGIVLALATSAGAQNVDARWAPFIGCWELVDGGASTCVAPAAPGAVTLSTRVEGKPVLEQTIVADGAAHTLSEPGCTGSQRAEWSGDGRKLFSRADLTCANEPLRAVSGLALMTGDDSWLDVQAIDIAGRTSVRIRKYRRAPGDGARQATSLAPYLGAATFTVDDVKEANAKVSPAALEAALAETGARFALRARDLVALDDAGVAGSVIDLMIANSFPEKFQVERRAEANVGRAYPPAYGPADWSGYWGLGYPYFYSYSGYYVDYRNYYSPYGYAYPGAYYYYYPGSGLDAGGEADAPGTSADGDGRVVNGVGYTRVRTREATARGDSGGGSSSGTSSSRTRVTPSGATQSSSGSSSSDSGSSSSGSGSSSSGGSSGSSGGSDTGRTAQPR
jgi:hypothetical protein